MSYNKLKEIQRHTLQGLWALARLHLDHNQLEFIHPDAFQGLTGLRLLQLEGNRLQQLHPATFSTFTLMGHFHVSTLRHLYLSDNGLTSLPSRLLAAMPQLENLYLHGNPWVCDCHMRWLHDWDHTSPGVLKCKKDRALPGGQLCPMCSSPRHLHNKELQALENLVCSTPVISSPHRTSPPEESEVLTVEDFREPFGNITLGLSDEHGNEVDLECDIGEPRVLTKINWEQVNQLASNITVSVDLECPVDREKYERLWRLIAYYSNVPAHLQRGILLRSEPKPVYVYRQDSEKDAQYYTGVKVNIMAQPAWLMQTSANLQLNRLQSTAKMVKLILSTDFSETVETERVRRQRRTWVTIESINTTISAVSAILGNPSQMHCNVHSSGQPVIHWMLPNGSRVEAPYSSPDNRVSLSSDGHLVIKAVRHADTGIYYCIAKVHEDLAVMPGGLPTSTQEVSKQPWLPGRGSLPRGKPRITKSYFQTFTVDAETDAELPCGAEGEPRPFLSWTKVASGASIAQNTRVQRFEVRPNGSLIIRNTRPSDGGQYLCTVQNQYGTDQLVVHLVVLSQPPRVLQPRHRDVAVRLADKVKLECKVEGHPPPRVTWVLPNHVHVAAAPLGAAPQQHVAVFSNGTLQIIQATSTDGGVYKCVGSNAAGADSVSVRLSVSVLPPVIQQAHHENATLPEGSPAYIHCTASGPPQPVVSWITPDGIRLTASQLVSGRNLIVFPNGTLYIRGLGQGHAGRYTCSASNAVASSTRTVVLSTRRNPNSTKASITLSSPQRTEAIYGGRLLLNCVATGGPEPRIIWRTPSKKLVDAQYSYDPRIKVFPNGTITIHSVTDKDSGDYLCVARNKMGDDYVLLRVDVLTRPAKIEQKQQRSNQEVVYGGDLKVDCVASGLPNPEISWALPDGSMVNPIKRSAVVSGGRSRRYVVFDNGTLYFNHVGMPEEGDYTCYAENQLGKDEMKVRVKVKVTTSPPLIQDKDQKPIRVFYGETVTLRCSAKGVPKPTITWISPTNRVISPALPKYQVLDDGTLVVQKVQRFDGGNYTCMSRNNAGQDYKVIKLEVLVTAPIINGVRGTANTIKVAAVEDQRKLVDCVAKGTPTPRIMWVLPGKVILPAPYYSNRMTVHQNGTLEIRSAKRTDSGQLACIARNEGGEVKMVVNLDVKEVVENPQIRGSRPDSLSLTVGNTMTLNCSLEGSKLPPLTWILPNGTPLHSGARFFKFFHKPDGSLIISNPSVAEAGMYRCLGRTSQGLVERTITLSPGRKPEINNRYHSPVSVVNGERLLLHCLSSGEPLRLTWTIPSGVVLNRPQRAGRYAVLPNGTLAIQHVSVYDRGSYMCRAANEYGSAQLSASVIVIGYPPRITNGPPSVTYAKHGVAVQLNCVATGIPRVEVAWETPDKTRLAVSAQPRLFGNKYLHPQGSLVIQNPTQRDAGVYRCTAKNAIGMDSKATILQVF
ncbi:Matrix-remodeling-associated protein 5 [Liparis tanakae]|uniref:Matrix-remodeling-associated protein 5 n=1 Tax=Liparis tanakae TaxID=230148 RepID=A0A4Z2F3B0_9TELE|nr:Matrix-remodeling-associated protein 5 [Liparis tanakae]